MFLDNLASSVLLICNRQHLTYERASERCQLSSRYFGDIARGKTAPTVLTLEKLYQGLKVTPNELLLSQAVFHQLTFRQPMAVYQTRRCSKRGKSVLQPVCPRCQMMIEHEQQTFCHYCGQKLDWSSFAGTMATESLK